VEQAGLFLMPLDDVRGWWRYHHLFADLLRARLQQERPARVMVLHRAAAAWHQEHDLADDAVRHALAAGDAVWAARLIEQYFDATYHRGQRATIHRWLAALPAGPVHTRPRLELAQAWMAVVGGHVEAAGVALDAAQRASAQAAAEPFEPSAGRAASCCGKAPPAIRRSRISSWPPGAGRRATSGRCARPWWHNATTSSPVRKQAGRSDGGARSPRSPSATATSPGGRCGSSPE
jgi:LuxR family maltose regulon positive regulatory protein